MDWYPQPMFMAVERASLPYVFPQVGNALRGPYFFCAKEPVGVCRSVLGSRVPRELSLGLAPAAEPSLGFKILL